MQTSIDMYIKQFIGSKTATYCSSLVMDVCYQIFNTCCSVIVLHVSVWVVAWNTYIKHFTSHHVAKAHFSCHFVIHVMSLHYMFSNTMSYLVFAVTSLGLQHFTGPFLSLLYILWSAALTDWIDWSVKAILSLHWLVDWFCGLKELFFTQSRLLAFWCVTCSTI